MALSPETLVVIPTYNEEGNLKRLIQEIQAQNLSLDLLVIDDNSPDGTGVLAETLSREAPLKVIHRERKMGIGSAHKLGFQYAMDHGYRFVITMDADFSHSPRHLREMLAGVSDERMVVASRYMKGGGLSGWNWMRRILTHTAHGLTRTVLGLPYDCTGGFRLYPVALLRQIRFDTIRSEGYAFLIELLFHVKKKGFPVREVAIVIQARNVGKSKISRVEIFRAFKTLLQLRMNGNSF
jgi:dolichol-phosphate mannosyltransferase